MRINFDLFCGNIVYGEEPHIGKKRVGIGLGFYEYGDGVPRCNIKVVIRKHGVLACKRNFQKSLFFLLVNMM